MNIITKVVTEAKFQIPSPVLNEAFKPSTQDWRQGPFNLDTEIINKVLKPRVLIDANLVAGEAVNIRLEGVAPDFRDEFVIVYTIPAYLTHNREIMSVLSISYIPYSNNAGSYGLGQSTIGPMFSTDTITSMQQLAEGYSSIPHTGSASCELIGYNKIRVTDPMRSISGYILRCYLANESYLNNLNPRSYIEFVQLCMLAIKSYIYNTLIIRIDQGYLAGGQEIGMFKSIVEQYAESEAMYQTFIRETWTAVAHMNNTLQHERYMKLQIPIGL